jgi:hypothetical protein
MQSNELEQMILDMLRHKETRYCDTVTIIDELRRICVYSRDEEIANAIGILARDCLIIKSHKTGRYRLA